MIIFDFEITITENVLGILALDNTYMQYAQWFCVVKVHCSQYYMQVSDKLCASAAFTPRNGMCFFMPHKTFQNFSE
jgi:hypothetical protein